MLERARTKRPGQTLIEVVIATLIGAMTTIAVFSVILSSFVSQKKADKKEIAAMVLKQAQQTLQTFVSADPNTQILPGVYLAPNPGGRWLDAGWALAAGSHNISSLMPADLCATTCSFVYVVTDRNCGFGIGTNACKAVKFDMTYAD